MLFQSTYYSGETFAKPVSNTGSYAYLTDYAQRLLANDSGKVEVRDAHGTLVFQAYTDAGQLVEWTNEETR